MSRGLCFWIIMLFIVLCLPPWPWVAGYPRWPGYLLVIVALALLGWQVYGAPLR